MQIEYNRDNSFERFKVTIRTRSFEVNHLACRMVVRRCMTSIHTAPVRWHVCGDQSNVEQHQLTHFNNKHLYKSIGSIQMLDNGLLAHKRAQFQEYLVHT